MTPQIEKTYPAGVNKFGYESDISAVVFPFNGNMLLNALTTTVNKKAATFTPCRKSLFFEPTIIMAIQHMLSVQLEI